MKIRFVEIKAYSNNVYDHTRLPRLGLPQLAAILAENGHDVAIYVEALAPVNWEDLLSAELVGFSTTTGTTPPAYKMADKLRAEGVRVVFGGAHVTFKPGEALLHADYVIRGEGHAAILELLAAIDGENPLDEVAGLSWHGPEGEAIHNPDRQFCPESVFAELPAPDLKRIIGWEKMITMPVMTQWGCPYDCSFCSVIKMFGRRVRARAVDDVLAQLETIPEGMDIFFYDDNFVVDKRRTKELLGGMRDRNMQIPWSAQMRAEAIFENRRSGEWDIELLELMRDTHCNYVYIGFESANPAALAEYNKQQTVDQITRSIEAFHAYGIRVHGMFVLGCDSDTPQTIEDTVKFAIEQDIDTVQFLTITPFPGTAFYDEMDAANRIITKDWSQYDGHHVVIEPKNMTAYQLQMVAFRAMLRFYAPRRVWSLLLSNIRRELPFLLKLFLRERKLRLALPRIAWLALQPEKAVSILTVLQNALDSATWRRLREVFIVPVFRRYAFVHTRKGMRQEENRRYHQHLKALTRPRNLAEQSSGQ